MDPQSSPAMRDSSSETHEPGHCHRQGTDTRSAVVLGSATGHGRDPSPEANRRSIRYAPIRQPNHSRPVLRTQSMTDSHDTLKRLDGELIATLRDGRRLLLTRDDVADTID